MLGVSPKTAHRGQCYGDLKFRVGEWIFMNTMNFASIRKLHGISLGRARRARDAGASLRRMILCKRGDRERSVRARSGGLKFWVGEWILMKTMNFAKIWEFVNICSRCARAEQMTRAKLARA